MASTAPAMIPIQRANCERLNTPNEAPIRIRPTTSQSQPYDDPEPPEAA